MRCLVLGARRYSFSDDEGKRVEGATVHYLTLDSELGGITDHDQVGELPMQVRAPLAVFEDLREAPAYYDLDFRQRPGPRGRPTLQLAGLSYLDAAPIGGMATLTSE